MSVRILKYPFGTESQLVVPFGLNDKVVLVAEQLPSQGTPTLWIAHETTPPHVPTFRTFRFFATGFEEINDEWGHVGSAVCGPLVWHVFGKQWLETADNERNRYLW